MKNVLKSFVFLLILFILVELISYALVPYHNLKYSLYEISKYEILTEEKDTVDSIFVGDSLIYSAFSPMEVWNNYGFTTFACANSAQLLEDAYNYLEIANDTQHPKVMFLETNVIFRNPKNKVWYYDYKNIMSSLYIINYHNNWKKFMFNFLNNDTKFSKVNVYKGFKYINKTQSAKYRDYMKYSEKVTEIPKSNLDMFDKIVKYCNQNNIKLVLVSTPNMKAWSYSKHARILNLKDEYGLDFIDLNIDNPLGIDWKTETRDKGNHLNYYGAVKVSNFIGEYLKTNNLVKDHRNDKKYESWNESYEIYSKSVIK